MKRTLRLLLTLALVAVLLLTVKASWTVASSLVVVGGTAAYVAALLLLVLRLLRLRKTRLASAVPPKRQSCLHVPPSVWKKPDPFLYSQLYLMSQGLDVEWTNPDIWLEEAAHPGLPITGNPLADTDYDIVARVWNGSFEAPAFNVIAEFLVASYGVGWTAQSIGTQVIPIVQVRGLGPSYARQRWRTPPEEGHFCLVVRLFHPDDANPNNNEGQENLYVVQASANPGVTLDLPLHNAQRQAIQMSFEASTYKVPEIKEVRRRLEEVMTSVPDGNPARPLSDFSFRKVAAVVGPAIRKWHSRGSSPVPATWSVRLPEQPVSLAPGQSQTLRIPIGLPEGMGPARYQLSIHVSLTSEVPYGGVTYQIEVK